MIRKFFVYCKSDGIMSALHYAIATILSCVYRSSTTNFYRYDGVTSSLVKYANTDRFVVKECLAEELETIDFPRLKLLNWRRWLHDGSRCYVGFYDGIPATYTWTHFKEYEIHGLGKFHLTDGECWIGPVFVHKDYRGRGLNKIQIANQMLDVGGVCYTSVNAGNQPSIRSFIGLGYKNVGNVVVRKSFMRTQVCLSDSMKNLNKI